MLFPKQTSRRNRLAKVRTTDQTNRRLDVETLECRRLLSSDGILPEDPQGLVAAGGIVSGTKWEDLNQNGQRDPGEPGLAGVTIYADLNNNGRHDANEPSVLTNREDPDTRFEEAGRYQLFVPTGERTIREVVPEGFRQTFPPHIDIPDVAPIDDEFATVEPPMLEIAAEPGDVFQTEVAITIHPLCIRPYELDVVAVSLDGEPYPPHVDVISHTGPMVNGCGGDTSVFGIDILFHPEEVEKSAFNLGFLDLMTGEIVAMIPVDLGPGGNPSGGHRVEIKQGDRVDGLDFGNARIRPVGGAIEGYKWLDRDGDGKRDSDEPGLGGVTIYIDANNNGKRDSGERTASTQFDDPFTDFDEGGFYRFDRVETGVHTVREVIPNGYAQTFPLVAADVISSETGRFQPSAALDFDVSGVKYTTSGDSSKTVIEISATWPNGCGHLFADQTAHTVIGNTIIVDAHGGVADGICTLAIKTDTVEISIPGLAAGHYNVVGTLHEGDAASLGVVGVIEIGASGAHRVKVGPAIVVSDVNFGNRQTGSGESVSGTKWHDKNGDGFRQRNEPGLGGVTIYVDLNNNGRIDDGEPFAVSSSDTDALGNYQIKGLEPGIYHVREVVPDGFRQTFPPVWFVGPDPVDPIDDILIDPLPEGFRPIPIPSGSHYVEVGPGSHLEGIDFGNQSTAPGAISGTKWADENGNGKREEDEAGLGGVTIYIDANYSQTLDDGELRAVTDENGDYTIKGIRPGTYSVREVIPAGFHQTYPQDFIWIGQGELDVPGGEELRIAPAFQGHIVTVLPDEVVEGIDFGNQKVEPGSISGIKWLDENGNGVREDNEPGLAGVTIYVDLNHNGSHEDNEPFAVSQDDGKYTIKDLKPFNSYAIREILPEGFEQTFPGIPDWFIRPPFDFPGGILEDIAIPFPIDFHLVYVGSGQNIDQINFGNRKVAEPGFISGIKWEDLNGNGMRDEGERGLSGFTIFVDSNRNGRHEFSEPFTVTRSDDPNTKEDESGHYTLKVRPGSYLVLEQQQRGFEQTYPNPAREIVFPFNLGHSVNVESGVTVTNIDFGNTRRPSPAVIAGTKWFDFNANGVRDRGEEPVNGVTVYLDANDNGRLDDGERSTVTGSPLVGNENDALVPFPPRGYYSFDVKPGDYIVREVIPRGYIQTYPFGQYEIGGTVSNPTGNGIAEGFDLVNISTSTTSPTDNGQSETQFTFESVWPAHEVEILAASAGVEDNVIFVHIVAMPIDVNPDIRNVQHTTVSVASLPFGDYVVKATLEEEPMIGPDGQIIPPLGGPSFQLESKFRYFGDDAHRVSVESGDFMSGLDFGNIAVPGPGGDGADSTMGEDPHAGVHDKTATPVEFHDGHLRLNSYVDTDGDQDVFRFVSNGARINGEGGRMDGAEDLRYDLIDQSGNTVASAAHGEPLEAETTAGETYYLRISGGQGQYQLDLFQAVNPNDAEALEPVPGDTNGDRQVDFADFLTLSANFGNEVDEAFADGDFDNDDLVTFADFLILSSNFGKTG